MTTLGKIPLILASTLFLAACGGSSSSSEQPPLSVDALSDLSLPSTHFGNRKIQFSGELDSTFDTDKFNLSLTHNGNTVDIVLVENTISSELELSNNKNVFILTISNNSETLIREFSVDYPFVSLETFQSADVVIGQQDFSSIQEGITASTFNSPYGNAFSFNNFLYLPDYSNDRILGFNAIPSESGAAADFVIGQEDFTSNLSDGESGTTGLTSLGGPQNMQVVDDTFYLITYNSNRIIASHDIPTTTGQLIPSFVIGQADSISTDSDCTASSLYDPESFIIADNKLIVTDTDNNRVLIWSTLPAVSGVEADIVLGFENFTCDDSESDENAINELSTADAALPEPVVEVEPLSLSTPSGVWSDGKTLLVADSDNSRLLIWNTFPTTNNAQPDLELGRELLTGNTIAIESSLEDDSNSASDATTPEFTQLDDPYHLHSNGNQLFLTDNDNHRLLIWNSIPTASDQQPDVILGQSNFTNTEDNDDNQDGEPDKVIIMTEEDGEREQEVASSRTLSSPTGAYTTGNQLIVTDGGNNRFLIFNDVTK